MKYLFLDTSHALTIGILNEKFEWIGHEVFVGGKTATTLHSALYDLLAKYSLKIGELTGAVQVAGPGSYTGMRVSDGFFQTLRLAGFTTYSFYHFEVPALLGVKEGLWISNAFKGEIFSYSWKFIDEKLETHQKLLLEKDFIQNVSASETLNLFTHHTSAFSPTFTPWVIQQSMQETSQMIKDQASQLFKKVWEEKLGRSLFYYRPIDQEFKKPN